MAATCGSLTAARKRFYRDERLIRVVHQLVLIPQLIEDDFRVLIGAPGWRRERRVLELRPVSGRERIQSPKPRRASVRSTRSSVISKFSMRMLSTRAGMSVPTCSSATAPRRSWRRLVSTVSRRSSASACSISRSASRMMRNR